jgi:hypothetical protein
MTFSETVAGSCISSRLPKDMSPYRLSLGIPGLNACAPTTFFALRRSAEENGFGFIFTSAHFLFRLLDRPAASPHFCNESGSQSESLLKCGSACAAPRQFVVSKHCAFQAALSLALFLCFKPQGRASLASSGPPCCNLSPSPCLPALSAGDSDPTPPSSDAAFVTVAFLLARCIPPSLRRSANPCLSLILLPVISLPHT